MTAHRKYLLNIRRYCESNVDITEDPACVAANKSVIAFIDKELVCVCGDDLGADCDACMDLTSLVTA